MRGGGRRGENACGNTAGAAPGAAKKKKKGTAAPEGERVEFATLSDAVRSDALTAEDVRALFVKERLRGEFPEGGTAGPSCGRRPSRAGPWAGCRMEA